MSQQQRSISQRLKKAKSPESKLATVIEWSQSWESEHNALIKRLEQALSNDNYDANCIALGELKAASSKKFNALPNVLKVLLNQESTKDHE